MRIGFACGVVLLAAPSLAATLILRDGRVISGSVAQVGSLVENGVELQGMGKESGALPIVIVDDSLRRTCFPEFQVAEVDRTDSGEILQRIEIDQRVALIGKRIQRLGPFVRVTEFDDDGRRIVEMQGDKGRVRVIQGITLITPQWTKVEGILADQPYVWDVRIATSSIPSATLGRILSKTIRPKNVEERLQLVRLFLQMERYIDAQREFDLILVDFPDERGLKQQAGELKQLTARKIIDEINLRRKAGQHETAHGLLHQFPHKEVAGETLQKVRELLGEYDAALQDKDAVLKQLLRTINGIKDDRLRERCATVFHEIKEEMKIDTFDRMADYRRLVDDNSMNGEEKFSLAASGWLLGSSAGGMNLAVALSQYDARKIVSQYLAESTVSKREDLLKQLQGVEGVSPRTVAQILRNMKPAIETRPPESGPAGFYTLTVRGLAPESTVNYHIQLPPEYDPYRHYPTVVALHGSNITAIEQLEWWAGGIGNDGARVGQAGRFGYIVIAVEWIKKGQLTYEYSAEEHHAVLASLRDACRRFAIDTDRVFLTGHSIGGDAAWDIGLAHPDIWAGVIPIVGMLDRYCILYWENARMLPFYIVGGELDGDKTKRNGGHINRYMEGRFDVTLVEYLGRGHEHFSDEIHRIFDWMGRKKRNFYPKEFKAVTMRTWDNFFWWVEVEQFPSKTVVEPSDWDSRGARRPMAINCKINGNNVFISSGAKQVAAYLSPDLIDLTKPVHVLLNGKPLNGKGLFVATPSVEVMLDDVRTRGDRLHPFWVKIE
jgi:predicted esterase